MNLKFLTFFFSVVRFSNALVKCNGKVSKIQLCNLHNNEYEESMPSFSPGNPMILKTSVIVYKIAELNDKDNTITLDFLLSVVWYDTRLSLESNNPNKSIKWYAVNEFDKTQIYTPTLDISGTKSIIRKRKYGAIDKDFFWYNHPDNMMEYQQSLKVTIYCSLNFRHFPFDDHTCDLNFGATGVGVSELRLNAPRVDYKNQSVSHDEGILRMKQSRLPFDIALESLEPFEISEGKYKFSYAGMRLHLTRNDFGVLIGGYYGPTITFSMLSLVSYSIKADIVSN